jgi:hypothetical protein
VNQTLRPDQIKDILMISRNFAVSTAVPTSAGMAGGMPTGVPGGVLPGGKGVPRGGGSNRARAPVPKPPKAKKPPPVKEEPKTEEERKAELASYLEQFVKIKRGKHQAPSLPCDPPPVRSSVGRPPSPHWRGDQE